MSGKKAIDWNAWWQLLRIANVFTAISNVVAGYLLTQPSEIAWLPLLLVAISSACLYEAGMVLNDVCDFDIDAVERPQRPLPSGRIEYFAARRLGMILIFIGFICAVFANTLEASSRLTTRIALVLASTIIAYNVSVKSTRFGPLCMGSCRALNVLLGASLSAEGRLIDSIREIQPAWQYALGVGIYTAGISLIAKREAGVAQRRELFLGIVAVLAGMATIASLPLSMESVSVTIWGWFGLFAILFVLVGGISFQLLSRRDSPLIGPAVVALIQMFILLDAMAAALARGWPAGLAVMCLYLPMRMLSRKNPMT